MANCQLHNDLSGVVENEGGGGGGRGADQALIFRMVSITSFFLPPLPLGTNDKMCA